MGKISALTRGKISQHKYIMGDLCQYRKLTLIFLERSVLMRSI